MVVAENVSRLAHSAGDTAHRFRLLNARAYEYFTEGELKTTSKASKVKINLQFGGP
jgi:hypothetical protein